MTPNSLEPPRAHQCVKCALATNLKTAVGDATNCDSDPPCDGTTQVPNAKHTCCGE